MFIAPRYANSSHKLTHCMAVLLACSSCTMGIEDTSCAIVSMVIGWIRGRIIVCLTSGISKKALRRIVPVFFFSLVCIKVWVLRRGYHIDQSEGMGERLCPLREGGATSRCLIFFTLFSW